MTFTEIERKDLPDIQSTGIIYLHQETGAKVLRLVNDDSNKAFSIAFRTPPYSDNGITHIMEHSVLNGSEKYPSKEPFVDLLKGSLNTFVNAMTYSDKTIYPVASTHQKDFTHLMSVYLDAVFKPNFRHNPQILAQEGWHYHLENLEDDLIYKGVVYNEMKGATASPEGQLYQHISRVLYEGTLYEFESGGHPRAIPDLTQEEFEAFYYKYYHPSNSLTVLYGDLDQEVAFGQLEEYFSQFEKNPDPVVLAFEAKVPQEPVFRDTYSITEGDNPDDKTFLALAWHTEIPGQDLDSYGLRVLSEILFGNNEAPLKKALLEAEIGGDIEGGSQGFGYPGAFVITAKYGQEENMDRFKAIVKETLEKLVAEGIDKSLITAAINKITFSLKENAISESHPRGVIYAIQAYSNWLYDESPFPAFEFSKYMDELNELANGSYFEDLIQSRLLDNPIRAQYTLVADPGKNDRIEAELHEKLQDYKASLSQDQLQELVDQTQALIDRQNRPDSPEDLAKIPSLTREDLTTETEEYPLAVEEFVGFDRFYFADQFTSGIDYVNLYFDISDLAAEDYAPLAYLAKQLTHVSTANYPLGDLRVEIDSHTGGISAGIVIYEDQEGQIKPYFRLACKALHESLEQLVDLMKEVLVNSKFNQGQEVGANTQRLISNFEQLIDYRANGLVADRAISQLRPAAKLQQAVSGIDSFAFLKEKEDQIKAGDLEVLAESLEAVLQKVVRKAGLSLFYIGDGDTVGQVKDKVSQAFQDLGQGKVGQAVAYQAGEKISEAFVTAQDVNYVGLALDAKERMPYNGASYVMSTIASYDYLWNAIRVQGGAYGAGYRHDRSGRIVFTSYRDPNIQKTLETYRQLPDYLAGLTMTEDDLTKNIIGSLGNLIQPLSASDKGRVAFTMHQTGVSHEDIVHLKEELLAAKVEDVQALSQPLSQALEGATVAVIGNKAQIEAAGDLFDRVIELY